MSLLSFVQRILGEKKQSPPRPPPLITNNTLPRQMSQEDHDTLILLGFKLGDPVPDKLGLGYMYVVMPDGWQHTRRSENTSQLIDNLGCQRALCVHAMSPQLRLLRRYDLELKHLSDPDDDLMKEPQYVVLDNRDRIVIHRPERQPRTFKDRDGVERSRVEATKWLDGLYPGWRNKMTYWDK